MLGCRHDPGGCAACLGRLRYSRLKLMALSPAHYQAWADKDTAAMERGRAVHAMVLGGPPVLPYPGKVRNGKQWEEFLAANDGAIIPNRTDYAIAAGMAEAVLRHRDAPRVLAGEHEVEIDWACLGRACQSHVDVIGEGSRYLTELKSTVCSAPERFPWLAHKMNYAGQLAFYRMAIEATRGVRVQDVYTVAVEQTPPHVVTVFRVEDDFLELGDKTVRAFMEKLLACEKANEWPGYVQSIVPLHAPAEDIEITYGGDGPDFDPTTGEVAA
jgi:exodeoxyribonuclease VIII